MVSNDVPANKMQSEQQVATVDSASKTNGPSSSFATTKKKAAGSELKQEKISDVLTGANSDSGMGISMGGRSASGTVGGILGANNSAPIADQSRAQSRPGKKLDRTANKLNYTPSEQVLVEFDESKPLADSADQDQGYNGTYRNEFARSQKIMGAVPGDLMFQRSADLITKDKSYFIEGQMVFQSGDSRYTTYPSRTFDDADVTGNNYSSYECPLGNYLHQNMHIGLSDDGSVDYVTFDTIDLTPTGLTPERANEASAHRLIKTNTAELDRMVMDTKAGDEKGEIWTPLARAVNQPTQTAALLASIEAQTGAYVHLAYSKATTNMSYQLNRGCKDGLNITTPAVEQCVGWNSIHNDEDDFGTNVAGLFNRANYAAGSPAIMIAAYDSVNKYHNKADFLLQPRGWRMHLQTADNNMNSLKLPAEYATVYAGQETFSTIDHEYDGLLPVCMTDKAGLIDPIDFNHVASFIRDHYVLSVTASNIESDYAYYTRILVPTNFISGVYVYQKASAGDGLAYAANVLSMDPDSTNGARTIDILIRTKALTPAQLAEGGEFYGYTALNSGSVITGGLSIHVPVIQNEGAGLNDNRISAAHFDGSADSTRQYPLYHGPYKYMYSDIRNRYIVTVQHPLIEGIVQYFEKSIGAEFRRLLVSRDDNHNITHYDEVFVPLIFSTQYMTLAQLLICAATPWISRVRVNSMKDVIYYEDNVHEYPFSALISLKDSPFKNYVNFGYSSYDEPLQCKVMQPVNAIQWVMPEFFWNASDGTYNGIVCPWYMNEEELSHVDMSCMSFPSIRSGIRLGNLDLLYGMSEKDVRLSLDRMTRSFYDISSITVRGAYKYGRTTDGQPWFTINEDSYLTLTNIMSCPRELGLCMDTPLGVYTLDPEDNGYRKAFTGVNGYYPSFVLKIWTNTATPQHPEILAAGGINVNRAANYTQKWYSIYANGADDNGDITGLVVGLNDEGAAHYSPFIGLNNAALADGVTAPTVSSFQRSMWTRLQLLPFVISPFDVVGDAHNVNQDIYDLAYIFGLAGFRASDYRESVYNREKEVVNQGFLFVKDPWIIESPIIKHGASSTGIVNTKGFVVRKQ